MGCSNSGLGMPLFKRRGPDEEEKRIRLQRKLCLARESPDDLFDLSQCGLRSVPSGVFSLCRVFRKRLLSLEDNRLNSLNGGGDLKDLYLLKIFNIAKNRFNKLPNEINYLENLTELYLNNNELEFLPDHIGDLVHLKILDVSHNLLKCLPLTMGRLKELNTLQIKENQNLTTLCKELCGAINLINIDLDYSVFVYPPVDILNSGTVSIMKYLCHESNIEYVSPSVNVDDSAICTSNMNTPYTSTNPVECEKSLKSQVEDWEAQEEHFQKLENEVYEEARRQRIKFLEECTQDQINMDIEFNKIQLEKDAERIQLLQQIRDDQKATEKIVANLLLLNSYNPQQMQQIVEQEQKERECLLELCRTKYIDLKKVDTLKSIESLLQEEYDYEKSLKIYGETKNEVRESFLLQEIISKYQINDMLKIREKMQSDFVLEMLENENIQRAAVGALLEKCDARSCSLIQNIILVETHLAKLSIIEMEQRKLQVNENLNELNKQRIDLSIILVDLLNEKERRRMDLLEILQAMEMEKNDSTNFWLIRYQQLLDFVPDKTISMQQQLDPVFVNYLLQEGVIHCLPFLIHKVYELTSLDDLTLQNLGVHLSNDRKNILKAIKFYIGEIQANAFKLNSTRLDENIPSAPPQEDIQKENEIIPVNAASVCNDNSFSECVVCMENRSETIFIPCGHLCCCLKCSDNIEKDCPICRSNIERRIRVIQP